MPGTRSDFIITQHPEFNLGRVASEQGSALRGTTSFCTWFIFASHCMHELLSVHGFGMTEPCSMSLIFGKDSGINGTPVDVLPASTGDGVGRSQISLHVPQSAALQITSDQCMIPRHVLLNHGSKAIV